VKGKGKKESSGTKWHQPKHTTWKKNRRVKSEKWKKRCFKKGTGGKTVPGKENLDRPEEFAVGVRGSGTSQEQKKKRARRISLNYARQKKKRAEGVEGRKEKGGARKKPLQRKRKKVEDHSCTTRGGGKKRSRRPSSKSNQETSVKRLHGKQHAKNWRRVSCHARWLAWEKPHKKGSKLYLKKKTPGRQSKCSRGSAHRRK